eukprot:scaffold9904_cov96-Cylindrotheca_fusiformis.AAC.1
MIGNGAFQKCGRLKRLGLNEGLDQIGKACFWKCKLLTEVKIPSTVKVISDSAFQECTSLETLTMQNGLQRIGEFSFHQCTSLKTVDIPSTVT